jgi:hypothetical protein
MIGANAACEIAQGPHRCLRRLCEAPCVQLVQLLHIKDNLSISGLSAHGCAQFLVHRVLLGGANGGGGILQSDPPFWKSVAGDHIPPQNERACMLRSESLARRRQLRTQ